ncbi:MAG: aminotransferase class I/II-fold pyridoxal phosphate-dependent enzyme [Lachnospiraceae bacterium]|nr:aminotransferase class I/II-fold pyridoxal phosphate-dependent enzyme [Lachnospiraceae bacterium]
MKYSFRNDYSEGACPEILEALIQTNLVQTSGYGTDEYCERAREAIRKEIGMPDAAVHMIPGGTQTNLILISSLLRPHEAVIGTTVSHINVHETGSVEATGHKVLTVETPDGILTPERIQPVLDAHGSNPHMVKPRMVYISNTTEIGTLYKKAELAALSKFCKEHNLILFLDGARLGCALTAKENDLTMADIAALTDCFYIGGTKNGALFGEALVLRPEYAEDFTYFVKQKGALFAKGRLLGIQFLTLFENGLFYRLAAHANEQAMRLKQAFVDCGVEFLTDSCTNQQFPILAESIAAKLEKEYAFEFQEDCGERGVCVRFVTSWATPAEAVEEFAKDLKRLIQEYRGA